jgi:hypothetical protein
MAEEPKVHPAGIDAATARELFLAAIDASPADPLAQEGAPLSAVWSVSS